MQSQHSEIDFPRNGTRLPYTVNKKNLHIFNEWEKGPFGCFFAGSMAAVSPCCQLHELKKAFLH